MQREERKISIQESEFAKEVEARSKCFPGNTLVFTISGSKFISDVKIGDMLSTTCGFSSVYLLAHVDADAVSIFVEITTDSKHTVQLSPFHYITSNGKDSLAKDVKLGDNITVRANNIQNNVTNTNIYYTSKITLVRNVDNIGLYSPFTMCGDIEVASANSNTTSSGIIASIYSDWFLEDVCFNPAKIPSIYHLLLAPLRFIHHIQPKWTTHFASYFESSTDSLHKHGTCTLLLGGFSATCGLFGF